jgi:hypothetical protein
MTVPDWDVDLTTYWENIDIIPTDTGAAQTGATAGMTGTNAMTDTMAGDAAMTGVACGMAAMSDTTSPAAGAGSAITDTNATTGTIEVQPLLAMRLSELLDYNVRNPEGEDLGAIEDIMVDWRQDRLAYAILSFGGFLGLGDKWFILPLDALRLNTAEQHFVFEADPERLQEAPGFDANDLPDTSDPTWDETIREYWQQNQ